MYDEIWRKEEELIPIFSILWCLMSIYYSRMMMMMRMKGEEEYYYASLYIF
jgi:hypothetical protein